MMEGEILDRRYWEHRAAGELPGEDEVGARNAAITSRYASWYLGHRDLFKWAGAAAFASHRIGLALRPPGFFVKRGRICAALARPSRSYQREIDRADTEVLRTTNNRIFADVAWAHTAYAHPHGGLAAVLAGVEGNCQAVRIGAAFTLIDDGRRAGTNGSADIWRGNLLLLQHEHEVHLQAAFAELSSSAHTFLSVFSGLDLEGDQRHLDPKMRTSFLAYICTRGLWLLLHKRALPNVADLEQRWLWAREAVFDVWRRIDRDRPELVHTLRELQETHGAPPYFKV